MGMTKKRKSGHCALCLQDRLLCDSHIIPEFCYRPTYDAKHRARLLKPEELRQHLVQKGIREYLLCEECEQKINEHESYLKSLWFDKSPLPTKVTQSTVTVPGVDYSHFKLFHLSVLWRAGVAASKPFGTVSLGPYAEKLRLRLFNSDPGPDGWYPFYGKVVVNPDRTVCYQLVSGPYKSRLDHFTVYYMCYAGCEWTFIVTDHGFAKYRDWTIKKGCPVFLIACPIQEINTVKVFTDQRKKSVG